MAEEGDTQTEYFRVFWGAGGVEKLYTENLTLMEIGS